MRRLALSSPSFPSFPVLLLVAAFACATSAPMPQEPAAATEPAAAPETPSPAAPTSTCYFGTSTQTSTDGTERPGAELLVRRTVDRASSRIVADVVRRDPSPRVPVRRYQMVYEVEGSEFTFTESTGAYQGKGRFTAGEPWAWRAWTESFTLDGGIRVESKVEIAIGYGAGQDALTAERQAYGPDGGVALTVVERLPEIGEEECARRFAEAPAPAPASP